MLKRKISTSVTFNNYTSLKLKNKAPKLGIYIYQLNQTKIFISESMMITTVLTHWRQQEFIEFITAEKEGEQEYVSAGVQKMSECANKVREKF